MKAPHKVGDMKFYAALAGCARQLYCRDYAAQYRVSDEVGVNDRSHTDYCELLARLSRSFDHPISALDLGCGTGRYFHCLSNIKRLVAVDVSLEMLKLARHPVGQAKITAAVDLVCANIFDVTFPPRSFDLIYSIGVIGLHCPLDAFLLNRIYNMLKTTGKFVFTTVDVLSPTPTSWKRIAIDIVRPILPAMLKRWIDVQRSSFRVSERELRSILDTSSFSGYTISKRYSLSGRIDFICIASV